VKPFSSGTRQRDGPEGDGGYIRDEESDREDKAGQIEIGENEREDKEGE